MATAPCATFSFQAPPGFTKRRISVAPLLCYSTTSSFPRKSTNRKNYLRPKLLKTLTKPFPPTPSLLPQQLPVDPTLPASPPENDLVFESSPLEIHKDEEFQVIESSGVERENVDIGNFSPKSILKYSLYFIGVFVIQTIFSVWFLGSTNLEEDKGKQMNTLGKRDDESRKWNLLLNKNGKTGSGSGSGNVIYLDENVLEDRIEEIRAMARDARRKEKKETKYRNDKGDIVGELMSSKGRMSMEEKEIDTRLVSLEKKLNSERETFGGHVVKESDGLNEKENNEALMFKKKIRFKSPSLSSRPKVKGFVGKEDGAAKNKKIIDTKARKEVDKSDHLKEDISATKDTVKGNKAFNRNMDSSHKDPDMRRLEEEHLQNEILKSKKENEDAVAESDNHSLLARNGSFKHEVGMDTLTKKAKTQKSDTNSNHWWLKLPYVLAIHMQKGHDPEEPGGFFTLRTNSQSQYLSDTTYTVTFEDRADANNFCYLLESFFEGLPDFSVDIVPLSTKELHEAVKSDNKKVIVVKKRQLKLYVGQPLEDVEIALHSLIEEDETLHL